MQPIYFFFLTIFLLLPGISHGKDYPITFTDSQSKSIILSKLPKRVVSLVPSITEILVRIGAQDKIVGLTHHSLLPTDKTKKEVVGGFFRPDLDRVEALRPDVIFYADLHEDVPDRFRNQATLVQLSAHSIDNAFDHIELLGRIFRKETEANAIIAEEKRQLSVIAEKIKSIPMEKRQRVMRLMGGNSVMTPGDDSFQNEYIRAAGGIAPTFGENGNIIPITLDQWLEFNPQVIYGCKGDRKTLPLLEQPDWNSVDAIRNKRILFFPCELTCRAATHLGFFVSWLSARIYNDEFGNPHNLKLPQQIVSRKPLPLDLDYIKTAEIIESDIKDFRNKTAAIHFKKPMTVISTLEGQKSGISTVINHYFPPPSWGLGHKQGIDALRQSTRQVLGLDASSTAMLFTGANMDNLAVVKKAFKEMEVTALVTAGVKSNALRMSFDTGKFYEPDNPRKTKKPGTINIILMTNMHLTPRSMTRALISATEGKSAALQDMDIRSSYSSLTAQATGTGTDNIIVVEGDGVTIDSSGGHTKMGELMARAVYEGVQEAVRLQNGYVTKRSVFQRLKERNINLHSVCNQYTSPDKSEALRRYVEKLLLHPKYADFLKAVMAISDDYQTGLTHDLISLDIWSQAIARDIAGNEDSVNIKELKNIPKVLAKGLGALLAGSLKKITYENTTKTK